MAATATKKEPLSAPARREPPAEQASPEPNEPQTPAEAKPERRSRLASRHWLVALLAICAVVNGAGLAYYKLKGRGAAEPPSPEIALGPFQFRADPGSQGRIVAAKFSLHVAFSPDADKEGRTTLAARKFRVQQDVEELLRRAHGGDFEDPKLRELKRQLQEQINETLGLQAIAEVIITDLALDGPDKQPQSAPPAAKASVAAAKPSA